MQEARRLLVSRQFWIEVAAFLVVLAAVLLISYRFQARAAAAPTPTPTPQPQREFAFFVARAQERAVNGNPVTLVSARRHRDRDLCRLLPDHHRAVAWVGRLRDVSTTVHQDGRIKVELPFHVTLHTPAGRALQPGTAPFESVAKLHEGDKVVFTGRFVAARDGTCLQSLNLFHRSAVLSPDFAFRFGSVAKAQ